MPEASLCSLAYDLCSPTYDPYACIACSCTRLQAHQPTIALHTHGSHPYRTSSAQARSHSPLCLHGLLMHQATYSSTGHSLVHGPRLCQYVMNQPTPMLLQMPRAAQHLIAPFTRKHHAQLQHTTPMASAARLLPYTRGHSTPTPFGLQATCAYVSASI